MAELKAKTTVEPARPYMSAATEGPISRLPWRAIPISALAEPSMGPSTISGTRPPRAGAKNPVARPSTNATAARTSMLMWPVASRTASTAMIAQRAASEISISLRRS